MTETCNPMINDEEWEQPQWVSDCIDHYWRTEKRGPSTGELLAWREADASCRMERGVVDADLNEVREETERQKVIWRETLDHLADQ